MFISVKKILNKNCLVILISFFVVFISGIFLSGAAEAGMACTVRDTVCTGDEVGLFKMSNTTNAHAGNMSSSYSYTVCCGGVEGFGTNCSDPSASVVLTLSAATSAHAELSYSGVYDSAYNICIVSPPYGGIALVYYDTDCSAYDTTIASMSATTTNAHVGNANAYSTRKICGVATAGTQSLGFTISDNTIGFGALSSAKARYATGNTSGSDNDSADAHTITGYTNATGGYVITVNGTTLTCSACGGATITPIGAVAAGSSIGAEQFGIRLAVNSGTGSVVAPYNTANWALDTASFPDVVATGTGDMEYTYFGVRYIANISGVTEAGTYSTALTYIITATF